MYRWCWSTAINYFIRLHVKTRYSLLELFDDIVKIIFYSFIEGSKTGQYRALLLSGTMVFSFQINGKFV